MPQREVQILQQQLSYINNKILYTDILNRLAALYAEINVDSGFYYATVAQRAAQQSGYKKGLADAANNFGMLQDIKSNLQQALRYFSDAYNRYSELKNVEGMIQATLNIAIVFDEMEKKPKALDRFKMAFALSRQLKNDSIMAGVYANYVSCFADNMPADSVQFYIRKARAIALKYGDYRTLIFADQTKAERIAVSQPAKAVAMLETILQNALADKMYYLATSVLIDLGDMTTDSAKAVNYYFQSLSLCKQKGFTAGIRFAYEKLYDFYQLKEDDETSLRYAQELLAFYDAQKNLDKTYGIDYMDYALKNQELTNAVTRLTLERRLLIFTIIVCVLALALIITLWRYSIKLKKTGNTLQMQFRQSELTAQSLEKLNKDYARVMKMVAHDLRNPISNIHMISELINSGTLPQQEVHELNNTIIMLSKTSFNLIEQLLHADLNEEQQLTKSEFDINTLLHQCVQLLRFRAKEKKQEIVFSEGHEFVVFADINKLTRVIMNLGMNGIKFSPENSTIQIKTFLKSNCVIIAVIDQGIGIPFSLQNKVFDPFTAAKRPGTNGEVTFGLGLYISKTIVEAHGGVIWFNSVPGNGTIFYVQLPLAVKAQSGNSFHPAMQQSYAFGL